VADNSEWVHYASSSSSSPVVNENHGNKRLSISLPSEKTEERIRVEFIRSHEKTNLHANLPPPLFFKKEKGKQENNSESCGENNNNEKDEEDVAGCYAMWETYLSMKEQNSKKEQGGTRNTIVNIAQNVSSKCWTPTLIQRQLWSILLKTSWNTIGTAPTSSGKTLSYAIPSLLRGGKSNIVVLVPTKELVHQVSQLYRKLIKIQKMLQGDKGNSNDITRVVIPIHGGVSRQDQVQAIVRSRSADSPMVVVATPGRLLDIMEQHEKDSGRHSRDLIVPHSTRHWIVLDEADQLTKEGDLGPQVHEILNRLTAQEIATSSTNSSHYYVYGPDTAVPRLLFVSATLSDKSRSKLHEWMGLDHVLVQVDGHDLAGRRPCSAQESSNTDYNHATPNELKSSRNETLFSRIPSHLEQIVHVCAEHKKPRKLVHTLKTIQNGTNSEQATAKEDTVAKTSLDANSWHRCKKGIVFYAKVEKLEYSLKLLKREGIQCFSLHGKLPTALRQKSLHSFASAGRGRDGEKSLCLLLATDCAARGIDIPGVDFVIQYDFPGNLEQYVHRCGRAGRSVNGNGRDGDTISLLANENFGVSDKSHYVIYSFFTRNMQRIAPDLVRLLEVNGAWIDPNLKELVHQCNTTAVASARNTCPDNEYRKKAKSDVAEPIQVYGREKNSGNKTHEPSNNKHSMKDASYCDDDDDYDDDEDFAHLAPNRIVLKRASHVSDASDDDEEEEEKVDSSDL
jgi:superfamily II DNA/RNA helicase